jgi:hypothetical protein
MATRAIRYDQLEFESARTATQVTSWCNYHHNDQVIWGPLQEAVRHQISVAGDGAQDYLNQISQIRNITNSSNDYYRLMQTVYGHLAPHILYHELGNSNIQSLMREKLIEMRDVCKAGKAASPNDYYDGRNDPAFYEPRNEMTRAMSELAREVNEKYFGSSQSQVISVGVSNYIVEADTTDDRIDEIVGNDTHYGNLWRINIHYLVRGGHGRAASATAYPQIPQDMMESFMENLVENHPAVALQIARHDQMFIDNPQAKSIGHSWTSRNRSEDCWFKIDHDQVTKRHTTAFAPPRTFFGKHTPAFNEMVEKISLIKADVITFLEDAKPQVKIAVDDAQALADKTGESMQKAVVSLVQGLLDDADTVDIGTAILGNIAGIAPLPIDLSNCPQYPNGYIQYTYHDYTRKQDLVQYFYPQHMNGVVSLSDFNVTDEVQGVLYKAYQENLQSMRDNHAHRCAQLARQIAQATTRHDAEVQVVTDAFTAYQAQV